MPCFDLTHAPVATARAAATGPVLPLALGTTHKESPIDSVYMWTRQGRTANRTKLSRGPIPALLCHVDVAEIRTAAHVRPVQAGSSIKPQIPLEFNVHTVFEGTLIFLHTCSMCPCRAFLPMFFSPVF